MPASTISCSSTKPNCGSVCDGSSSSKQQYPQSQCENKSTGLGAIRQAGQVASWSPEEMRRYRLNRGSESQTGSLPGTGGASNREEDARRAIREFEKRFGQSA